MPSACDSGFSGTHIQPPDQAVAPPTTGAFSATSTSSPCQAAVTAADRPAAPAPTTSRSQSRGSAATVAPPARACAHGGAAGPRVAARLPGSGTSVSVAGTALGADHEPEGEAERADGCDDPAEDPHVADVVQHQ